MSIAKNINFFRNLPKMNDRLNFRFSLPHEATSDRLTDIACNGGNPGNLRMRVFVPEDLPETPPLVVVLHGCTQSAYSYDVGAGWSTLADRFGFALLMPEQQRSNNPNGCFNWFEPQNATRGCGETCSIQQMIDQMSEAYDIDRTRIFITGLSAGGAMTSVMLANYPETFAAGAVIAGLPYGIATNLQEALAGMFQAGQRSGSDLGYLVRNASSYRGPWPKISVWHGSSDTIVNPINADHVVSQWLDVHDLPAEPMSENIVDGYPHQMWWGSDGKMLVESFTITGMAHGTPVGAAENDETYGQVGRFFIEAGISSSYHIAKFFGLTDAVHHANADTSPSMNRLPSGIKAQMIPIPKLIVQPRIDLRTNISTTIDNALKAAGLMR